ncbi:unnamed protein product [Lactuca saligna]|uniref:CRIB domain-containing protein n=1 Tax=Lactuca saligna TaxID=75948 RepID=A0AA35VM22_LACSI|nr:unnamed protein product [Lactuca saligna]
MKGLLKGLRYISEIFEADNEKEPEIQIGAPTDVKHVAHIGCDGPSSNAPSWMNEFQGSSDAGSSDLKGAESSDRRGKSKKKKQGSSNSISTPDREAKPRKNKSSASDNESSRARRTKNSSMGSESPAQDPRAKKDRNKKRASNNDEDPKGNEMRLKENVS